MLYKSIICKYFLKECRCALWSSLALRIIHINAVYPKLLTVRINSSGFGKILQLSIGIFTYR